MVSLIMPYDLEVYGLSDVGLVRQNNEDIWTALPVFRFYALADGMGGHLAGEVASKEAIKILNNLIEQALSDPELSLQQQKKLIHQAIKRMNLMVYKIGRSNPDFKGMGTTLCCMSFHEKGVVYAHVGDSRIYRFRKNKLVQLTRDHSLLRQLLEMGQLSERQAGDFAYKNIITKAIGTEPHVEPSVHLSTVEIGDIFLMCTDGLTDMLTPKEITDVLMHFSSSEETAKELVLKANQRGGYDNITVVVAKILPAHEQTSLP